MRNKYFNLATLAALLCLWPMLSQAQPYGNEWIQFDKTYTKIKVGKEGIYRIPKAALDSAGLPASLNGAHLSLWRDGQEVPLYTSTAGVMGVDDYIEFFAMGPNGKLDKELYWPAEAQLNDRISLFTDTACYFLAIDSSTAHLRYTDATTTIPSGLTAVPYMLAKTTLNYKSSFIGGELPRDDYGLYSSQFTKAEGFIQGYRTPPSPVSINVPTQNVVTTGPDAVFSTSFITQSYNSPHQFEITINGTAIADTAFGKTETIHMQRTISSSLLLPSGNNAVKFTPLIGGEPINYYGICGIEIKYPRSFAMANLNYYRFYLPPATESQYLVFTGFKNQGNIPRLYDVTNRKFYEASVVSNTMRFYLEPSLVERELVIYSKNNTTNFFTTGVEAPFQFTNWQDAAKEGNYVILTHHRLEEPVDGHNYIQEYAQYRASAAGGNYAVTRADVEQLYDQFAYGYRFHPLAIRHFLKFANNKWSVKPDHVFLIGRGIFYYQTKAYLANDSLYNFPVVPTYGHPGSDQELVNISGKPGKASFKVGRLSVFNAREVGDYLKKVKDYEQSLKPAMVPTLATESWKKQALHIAGGVAGLCGTLNLAGNIISDSLTGKDVYQICKSTTEPVSNIDNASVDSLMHQGLSMITYYGHAASNMFEYNLNDPESYNNVPRVPFFLALGCDVAQMFILDTTRTMTERYVLAKNGGAIAMVASNNTGYTNFLTPYLSTYYNAIARKEYGNTLGGQYQWAYDSIAGYWQGGAALPYIKSADSVFWVSQFESMLFAGDPAVNLYHPDKPDYHVANSGLSINPPMVNNLTDSFRLQIISHNLARAGKDTVLVEVKHTNPSGTTTTVSSFYFYNLHHTDTAGVWIPVHDSLDVGLNRYTVTIDADNRYEETAENNNVASIDLFIYSDDLVPVYPYEFSIVHQQPLVLKASTLNPFRGEGRYLIQLDTSELFNSAGGAPLAHTVLTGPGGLKKWQPAITLKDSTVYYWRTAVDSTVNGSIHWTNSSFLYLANGSNGWNQSHYYQWQKNSFNGLSYDSTRTFRFKEKANTLKVYNTQVKTDFDVPNTIIYYNDAAVQNRGQNLAGGIQIMVIDSLTGRIRQNNDGPDYSGALPPDPPNQGVNLKEFRLNSAEGRLAAARYLRDSVANGSYVMIRNYVRELSFPYPSILDTLKADTVLDAAGYSFYKACKDIGFTDIDSFYFKRAFIFFTQKGIAGYPTSQIFNDGIYGQVINATFQFNTTSDSGKMNSVLVGPAQDWKSLHWKTRAADGNPAHDLSQISVYGIAPGGAEAFLFRTNNRDTSLATISATSYPNLRLIWLDRDTASRKSVQQQFWRVLYTPMPEAALNPGAYLAVTDSAAAGADINFAIAIENLTDIPMDSMLVRYRVVDRNFAITELPAKRYRPLGANDTLHATYSFSSIPYYGSNYLYIEANPDKDQPETFHPNNLGYVPFRAGNDQLNPLLDVTFDGVHILNRDIVSPKPFIKILLRDENEYLKLDDTTLATVALRYPDAGLNDYRRIPFDGNILKFIPATANGKNEAYLEFRPQQLQDGIYGLRVTAKDKSGNAAAKGSYDIEFEVINKSTVTQVLNYPNPFSTVTAFVFTLTGSEIPTQFKIQILTVTGKVVREITRQELGPIHIGRNITEYKWDGRDQYGQLLGNGVYMYRIVTNINGKEIERRNSGADKYFKNGWGKMYIMR